MALASTGTPFNARTAEDEILIPGGDRKAREFNIVVFPAPELPKIASSSPLFAMPQTEI